VKVSADRILYQSRVIAKKLKDNMNLVQRADDDTIRRAIARVLSDSYKELEAIEEKVQASLSKRKQLDPRDLEYQFARRLEEELQKHGA
jgi:hypothetical protein